MAATVEHWKNLERQTADKTASWSLRWYDEAHGVRSTIEVRTALKHLRLKRNASVLDAGSGVGRVTLQMAKKAASVLAVDISPKCIEQLGQYTRTLQLGNVAGMTADLNSLDLHEEFDRVVAVETIQHIPTDSLRIDALRRLLDALKPGGVFVMVNYKWQGAIGDQKEGTHADGRYRIAMNAKEVKDLLSRAGFRHPKVRGCVNLPYRLDWVTKVAPTTVTACDVWLSLLPLSVRTGKFLVASGVK